MARITEQTIIDLFIEVERDLDQAIDSRRHIGRRMDMALASGQPAGAHEQDYQVLVQEIDDLRQQRKSIIDLAVLHGLDAGKLLKQAAQAPDAKPAAKSASSWESLTG